jgi:cytochrome c oxidase cbb3-type subunit 4
MSEFIGAIFSAWTVVVAVIFFGIVAWAWSGRRRDDFEAAARLPLETDDELGMPSVRGPVFKEKV